MSNDMRIVKFETLIKDVNDATIRTTEFEGLFGMVTATKTLSSLLTTGNKCPNISLALIYDYNQLNDYGKIVMEQSSLYITDWSVKYSDIDCLKDTKNKIEAAKELVRYCKMNGNRDYTYKFIFWAMMVLSVDKTDKEEHLSLICDFARMLKISDDEMEDILQVIKVIYHEEQPGFEFKSKTVPVYFNKLLGLYE